MGNFGLPYEVVVGNKVIDRIGEVAERVAPAFSFAIISDENVAALYGNRALKSFAKSRAELFTMKAGEPNKNIDSWQRLTEAMLNKGCGRDSAVVALGGGIVGDVAGFVAATFMRGIPYVQVPTTVVAMVDSSIGGKTGVNASAGKNLVGAFHRPRAVLADPTLLATLPLNELRAGMAEVVKHGVIADAKYFGRVKAVLPEVLESRGSTPLMTEIIGRSIEIKAAVVIADERESGLRKTLNFGHTIGHAIEALSRYEMLHGEAISVGMYVESLVAEKVGLARSGLADTVRSALEEAQLPTVLPAKFSAEEILDAAASDKKARAGELEFALPVEIGRMAGENSGWSTRIPKSVLLEALK